MFIICFYDDCRIGAIHLRCSILSRLRDEGIDVRQQLILQPILNFFKVFMNYRYLALTIKSVYVSGNSVTIPMKFSDSAPNYLG